MAVWKQIWLDIIKEGFYPDGSFLSEVVDMSEFVEYNTLNLAEAGADPDVLIDNTTFPIPASTRTDIPHTLPLATLTTKSTIVRNIEEMETNYKKMDSAVRGHRNALYKKAVQLAAYNYAPDTDGEFTPVLKTKGNANGAIKRCRFQDIIDLQTKFHEFDADPMDMVLVLSPQHAADLKAEDMALYKQVMSDRKLFDFNLYVSSAVPTFDITDDSKQAVSTAPDAANLHRASIAFLKTEVMKADGDYEMFLKEKDPDQQGDVFNFQKRFLAKPIRGKGVGTLITSVHP
ncbi:hypothetical protein [Flammeovirga sp. OC4]|uniref:hypothetical protein n=1 Tax=Flammeovirga sp. OC4 TaxID=1382345 RepID=UPI0005C752E9|nr:hypothetical protein [Flammeovirga sp. OC4]